MHRYRVITLNEHQRYYQRHREEILARCRERHRNNQSPNYRKLKFARKKLYDIRNSIEHHRRMVTVMQAKLKEWERIKEELELAYGAERAARKKGKVIASVK